MTTHYSSDYQVKPYIVQLAYLSKDGTKQVAIRVRIIHKKTNQERRINIVCYNEQSESIKLTPSLFHTKKYDIAIVKRIAEIQERVVFAVHHYLSHNLTISKKKITQFVYNRMEAETDKAFSNENVDDPAMIDFLENIGIDTPVAKDVINKVAAMKDEEMYDDETGEQIDIEDIITGLQSDHDKKKEAEEIKKMGVDERYKKGYYDKSNIFDVFGFCWSINPNTNKPFVSKSYRSLILSLADYRANGQPYEHISKLNFEWVNEFILFLKNEGYANVHPKGYTPFSISDYEYKLETADRGTYAYKSFDKQIKHVKRYIEMLQKANQISKTAINHSLINTTDYFSGNTITYTRASHALNKSELDIILNSKFEGKVEIARQMFLLQVFAGGLRNEEFYNEYFKLAYQNGEYYFMWYASKANKSVENPLIEGYSNVLLEQLNYSLPKFLKIEEYRSNLKAMATNLDLNRIIRYQIPLAKTGEFQVIDKMIYEIISPYWCRKTFVRLAKTLNWRDDKIIQWTGHGETKTLKHYFDQLSAEQKKQNI